jgi:hypothetical protein
MGFSWGPPERPEETLFSGRPGPPPELVGGTCCVGCPSPSYKCSTPEKCPVRLARRRSIRFMPISQPRDKRRSLSAFLKELLFR